MAEAKMDSVSVPEEILEKILLNCDGVTLLKARQVFPETVDYLSEKTNIWEWCCKEDIPKNEIVEYAKIYQDEHSKWLKMYVNWCSWENNIPKMISSIDLCPVEIPKISCIAVSRNHYAVGSEDGRLRIYTEHHRPLFCQRIVAVKIIKVFFLEYNDEYKDGRGYEGLDMRLVVAWRKGFYIFCFDGNHPTTIHVRDVKVLSVYENYICYEKVGGRLTIARLYDKPVEGRAFQEIWFTRIYSHPITCFTMWNGTCTFLINGYIKTINYMAEDITPMEELKKKTYIKFNFPLLVDTSSTQILRDDVIISLYNHNDEVGHDFIEIIILEEEGSIYSKKLFNTFDIFSCFITCICLYGNTLVLGVDSGNVYFYHVSSWKNLDLRTFDKKIIVGKHPIINIAVRETEDQRKFYVSSRFNIHEITGS